MVPLHRDAALKGFLWKLGIYLLFVAVVTTVSSQERRRENALRTYVDPVTGVQILSHLDPDMFPASWDDPSEPTVAEEPEAKLIAGGVRGVLLALHKYPTSLLRANLKRVYLVQNLLVDGVETGGVNAPELKTIYVDLDNVTRLDEPVWAEETIHHEFAHLLTDIHSNDFSEETWAKLNKPGFKYGDGGTEAIRTGHDGGDITDEYLQKGFAEEYGMSDIQEDFATLTERIFVGDVLVRKAAARYPIVGRKVDRIISFYETLNPAMTKDYFRHLPTVTVNSDNQPPSESGGTHTTVDAKHKVSAH